MTAPLTGSTKDDWALYNSATGAAVFHSGVSTRNSGASYAFAATLTVGTSYRLLYTKPDVIAVPEAAGHIAIGVPSSTDVVRMTLPTTDGAVVPATITHGEGRRRWHHYFPQRPKG